jgi:CheY-like chemotaxis protein
LGAVDFPKPQGTGRAALDCFRMSRIAEPTALIVEDEPMIRMLAVEAFSDAGFLVLEAQHAADALVVFGSRSPIHVVITDVNMPGEMDGIALAEQLNRVAPGIHLIITSALPIKRPIDHLPAIFVSKPYDVRGVPRDALARLAA